MIAKPKIAISCGDINGVGPEILLASHQHISRFCQPIYCIDRQLLQTCATHLGQILPDLHYAPLEYAQSEYAQSGHPLPPLTPGQICPKAGAYAYHSFRTAIALAQTHQVQALVTLPIHKTSWQLAGIGENGHTEVLRRHFEQQAIMLIGSRRLFVALYTEHLPLARVAAALNHRDLKDFLCRLAACIAQNDMFGGSENSEQIGVLGCNPHCETYHPDHTEDRIIAAGIAAANAALRYECFVGPIAADTAFTPAYRQRFGLLVAIYHDQGLAPLKALYFEQSVNITLGLPILRSSVDHGTAFDIAYQNKSPSCLSYHEACHIAAVGGL